MTHLRAFLARFRDAVATTSISMGPLSVTLWQQPDRGESPLKNGHIQVKPWTRDDASTST